MGSRPTDWTVRVISVTPVRRSKLSAMSNATHDLPLIACSRSHGSLPLMDDLRIAPAFVADERTMLNNWLEWHRGTLAVKCAGLSETQLRERSAPPSSMSLLGLVRHMAHVERVWFRHILNDEDVPRLWEKDDNVDADFDGVDQASAEEAFATWQAEIEHARTVSAGLPLDAIGRRPRRGQDCSHRWILVHMIEEYARHNGHADLLRERIDGATGA